MLSFRYDENVDKNYGISDILGVRVEILPSRKSKLVPCKKRQAYGHTQRYCSKEPHCVRCTGKHLTIKCNKPKDAEPKYIHSGRNHPANYRGCTIAKEMQKLTDLACTTANTNSGTLAFKKWCRKCYIQPNSFGHNSSTSPEHRAEPNIFCTRLSPTNIGEISKFG